MKIETGEYHYVKYDGDEYIRFSKDKWCYIFNGLTTSLEVISDYEKLEEEFQKQLTSK